MCEEEPLTGDVAICHSRATPELDHEPLAEALWPGIHNRREFVLEYPPAAHAHVELGVGNLAGFRVDDLPPVLVALVLRRVRIVDGTCRLLAVVHRVDRTARFVSVPVVVAAAEGHSTLSYACDGRRNKDNYRVCGSSHTIKRTSA